MNLVQQYNQAINQQFKTYLKKAEQAFQAIAPKVNPLFIEAVDKLNQFNYDKMKAEMVINLMESCQEWLSNDNYKNTSMDAILFEYDYAYSENIEALAYGINGDLEGYDYNIVNGIEAKNGILLTPFIFLSFINDDYVELSETIGFSELNDLFGSYTHLLVQESFAAFAQSNIFKKIARKPIFFMALGEHDMKESRLYYVCEDEAIFKKYLIEIENEAAGIENEKTIAKKYAALKYRVSELLDVLAFSNDDSQIDIILDGLQELINDSPKHKYWAMAKLGSLYVSRKNIEGSLDKARQYFEIVIEKGKDSEKRQSAIFLAEIYYDGKAVVKNLLKAKSLIMKAHNISALGGRFLELKTQIEKEIMELNN